MDILRSMAFFCQLLFSLDSSNIVTCWTNKRGRTRKSSKKKSFFFGGLCVPSSFSRDGRYESWWINQYSIKTQGVWPDRKERKNKVQQARSTHVFGQETGVGQMSGDLIGSGRLSTGCCGFFLFLILLGLSFSFNAGLLDLFHGRP